MATRDIEGEWTDMGNFNIPSPVRITDGHRHRIDDTRGLFVLHAALLHTGKVLMFCGHVEDMHYGGYSYVFDPANPSVQMIPITFPSGMDLFCCHYVNLPDGRLMVIGGSVNFHVHGSMGARNICFFTPDTSVGGTGTWSVAGTGSRPNRLFQGRWYPTVVLAADGRILVFSGRAGPRETTNQGFIADKVELITIRRPGSRRVTITDCSILNGAIKLPLLPIYPGMHLAPNGKIYFTGTNWGQEIPQPNTISIVLPSGATAGTWTDHGVLPNQSRRREEGMSVLLPPAQAGRILVVGGSLAVNVNDFGVFNPDQLSDAAFGDTDRGPAIFDDIFNVTDPKKAEILDTTTPIPTWSSLPNLNKGRTNSTCVILPDSSVLIVGGHDSYKWFSTSDTPPTNPSLLCELFDGANFIPMAALNHPRMYHSIAILLPNGSVLAAGGADPNAPPEPELIYPSGWNGPTYGAGQVFNRKDFEIYKPTYFFKTPRPVITEVLKNGARSRQMNYGESFVIQTPQGSSITKVGLTRLGCITHHTDTEQRYVELTIVSQTASEVTVSMPIIANNNAAPPGYYMLWIIDNLKMPCENAEFVQLTNPPRVSP
jgi:Domain of unknown function (DUF1929)